MAIFALMLLCTLPPAAALAVAMRPRSGYAGVVALALSWWGVLVVITELVGRVSFTPGAIGAACALLGVLGVSALLARRGAWRAIRPGRAIRGIRVATAPWTVRVLLLAWVALMVYAAVALWTVPASVPDVMRYHLPQAIAQVRDGVIGPIPELDYRANHFPHGVQILYALSVLFTQDDRVLGLAQVPISGVLWVGVCAMAARACGIRRRWALLTALLASFVAPVMLQMRAEMPDTGHVACVIAALVIALAQRRTFGRAWLAFGIALGLAIGTKSSGPLVGVVAAGAWCVGAWRARGAVRFSRLLGAGAVALLVGGWVYATNLIHHANPVFPMALRIGPITLPGPDAAIGISMNAWMYDFGASPLERLAGGLARWPRLLLNLEPFNSMGAPAASGFGPVTAVCVVGAALGVIGAAVRGRWRTLVAPTRGHATLAFLTAALLCYNALFLSTVSLITAPKSTVDARYQLHLALLAAVLAVWAGSVARPMARRVWSWALVLVALQAAWSTVTDDAHRGLDVVAERIVGDRPRTFVYGGDPIYIARDPGALLEMLGDEDVIAFGRGRVYPFMFPDFQRRVYPTGGLGPHMSVVDRLGVPAPTVERLTERIHARHALQRGGEGWEARWDAYNRGWFASGGREALRAYFVDLAHRSGAGFLYSAAGRHWFFEDHPAWTLVHDELSQRGGHEMALYRFTPWRGVEP